LSVGQGDTGGKKKITHKSQITGAQDEDEPGSLDKDEDGRQIAVSSGKKGCGHACQ